MTRVCVDLFSGLGGFSEAMLKRGWEVHRFDNDPRFEDVPYTTIADVFELDPGSLPQEPDLLVMSPPCNCFSTMTIRYYWKGGVPDERAKAAIRLVKQALWIKDQITPLYWVLENPTGMMRRVLGNPPYRTWWAAWGMDYLKPTDLWGILPYIKWPPRPKDGYVKIGRTTGYRQVGIQGMKDSAESSMIPYGFSMALCLSIENASGGQVPITDYIFEEAS